MNEYLVESILVLEGLSHPVNIGLRFLQKHYAVMYLTPERVTLEMGQVQVDLVKKGVSSKGIKRRAAGPGSRVGSVQTREAVESVPSSTSQPNSTEKDVLLPAGTPFYAYFGERKS